MEIKQAIFYRSIMNDKDLPNENRIEIALSGRSNVGKSSFINSITNNSKLARVSKVPGKTITLNFYLINNDFYFVDMPGYGYAANQKNIQYNFSEYADKYIRTRKELKGFIMIIDSRTLTKDDIEMKDYLVSNNIPFIVILSKMDKLKRNDIKKRISFVSNELNIQQELVIPYSSLTKENLLAVLDSIEKLKDQ